MIDRRTALTADEIVIGAFFDVYNTLRFGFLEAVYVRALEYELRSRGLDAQREAPVTVQYKGQDVGLYRVDLLVDGWIVVEAKATKHLDPNARYQTLNCLRATGSSMGLLLHFGPRATFQRIVVQGGNARSAVLTRSHHR